MKSSHQPSAISRQPERSRFKSVGMLFIAALREIFDESAYLRFLARTGYEHSTSSYRAFIREHAARKARQTKCC